MRLRAWLEIPDFLALALLCALVSNALAGPARRLSWFPRAIAAPVPASASATVTNSATTTNSATVTPTNKTAAPPTPPKATPTRPDPNLELLARFPALSDRAQADITGDDAAWLQAHRALFVDARRSAVFAQGHIQGARNLSAWEDGLAEKVEQLALFTPDLKLPVVVYCTGGDCHDSHLVAQKLWLAGFRNLLIYVDGFPDWERRALPVAKGEAP